MSASLRINYAECPAAPEVIRANVSLNGRSANFFFLDADIRCAEGGTSHAWRKPRKNLHGFQREWSLLRNSDHLRESDG